jgi:formylglycine-generating enzyme required for sulfatase activity
MVAKWLAVVAALALANCSSGNNKPDRPRLYRGGDAPLSRAADSSMLEIPAGSYIAGSTESERVGAYDTYKDTAGHDGARANKWFEREQDRHMSSLPAFRIDMTPVTMAAYAEFVSDTSHRSPSIDEATWKKQGFIQKYEKEVVRYIWDGDQPPPGRQQQPVVLVSWDDATAYCAWRGDVIGDKRRLPTADEFEKAARGVDGNVYPWGNAWDASKLNSGVAGPRDLVPVGSFPGGASPYGMLDAAGNVFQWTATPWPVGQDKMTVKGSAWEDFGGVGRGASKHGRQKWIRHAIVGFRCAG